MTSGRARTPRRRAKRGVERAAIGAAIAAGRQAPLTRSGVASLRDAHAADAIELALQSSLDTGETEVATALAFALAAHGRKIPESSARRLLPDLERLDYIPVVVAHADADPLTLMESLIALREQTVEADAVMAAIAARSFIGGVPPHWVPLVRNLCMDALPADDASVILGSAFATLAKDELASLLAPHVGAAKTYGYKSAWIAHNYDCPPLEALPEQPRPKVIAEGFTLRRGDDAKVGRNDPCPCGSGTKYKKCCAAKDASAASRAVQLDPSRLTSLDLERMRPRELVRLDPQRLSLPVLQKSLEQLAAFRRWREVERALDALQSRAEADVTTMERVRLIQRALGSGAFDVAERQQTLLPVEARDDPSLQATWAVARPSAESLATLEVLVEEGLMSGEPDWFFDVAFPLLDHAPALGVVFARGCMGLAVPDDDAGRNPVAVEVQQLLLDVEFVRLELGLDERDDAHEILAALEGRATLADEHRSAIAKAAKGDQKLRVALDEAKEQLERDRARIASLETQLRALTDDLDSARAAGALDPHALEAERRAARARLEESEEDRRSLRARVEELKAVLKESSEERAELRRELRRITALGEEREAPLAPAPQETPSDETSSDPSELPSQAMRVPSIKKNAAEALLAMPAKASRAALESIAALASGDASAWRAAKRMQAVDDVWSARVGIHHRLLYRIADDTLEVLEFVTRESLDTVLMRYRRGA